jgi:hypothetical protein
VNSIEQRRGRGEETPEGRQSCSPQTRSSFPKSSIEIIVDTISKSTRQLTPAEIALRRRPPSRCSEHLSNGQPSAGAGAGAANITRNLEDNNIIVSEVTMGSHDSRKMSYQPHWNNSTSSSGRGGGGDDQQQLPSRFLGEGAEAAASGKQEDVEEENTSRTSETGALSLGTGSPRAMTPDFDAVHDSSLEDLHLHHYNASLPPLHQGQQSRIGTPSTVSTAPSTDDASMMTDYRLEESMLPHLLHSSSAATAAGQHRRVSSWGSADGRLSYHPHHQQFAANQRIPTESGPSASSSSSSPWGQGTAVIPSQSWNNGGAQQRVASFRGNDGLAMQQHQQYQPHPLEMRQSPQQYGYNALPRRPGYAQTAHQGTPAGAGHHHQVVATPPRGPRAPPKLPHSNTSATKTPTASTSTPTHHSTPSSNSQRSPSEVLKTLLRKKACLYEPDTSRAVALATWLVGRELALEYGFFSRQQLQSGVHTIVANKIDSGIITRTKVNRCMQIILNSCFHYIIPRTDGSEEKGDTFCSIFARESSDDQVLLQYLPSPWNDLKVEREAVLEACLDEGEELGTGKGGASKASSSPYHTPKNSPKLSPMNADKSPGKDSTDGDGDSKRAVLLCFNENVRSAEDVFRCHNEFIRDTANASHLQLTAQEWQAFFGRDAASSPYLWGNIGIPVVHADPRGGLQKQADILGQMSPDEANKFRTTWCNKRYDHDHELCGFAHVEVCGGWLRRNPAMYAYKDEICSHVTSFGDKRVDPFCFGLNECPEGINCTKAHSVEEITYHPQRYKVKMCSHIHGRTGSCPSGDICPDLHPIDVVRHMKKHSDGRHGGRHGRKDQHGSATKNQVSTPSSAPIVYASPAPLSSFEHQLGMPGLQNLYRRNCSVIRSHVRTAGKCKCCYSYFGDDSGIMSGDATAAQNKRTGLAPVRRV